MSADPEDPSSVYEWQRERHESDLGFFGDAVLDGEELHTVKEVVGKVTLTSLSRENMHSVPSTGLMLWEGTKALSQIIQSCADCFEGKRAVELGCGCSPLNAMALAQAGAGRVVATDGNPEALSLLRENAERNGASFEVRTLRWDNDEDVRKAGTGQFDVVVASDVLYIEEAIPALFRAAASLLSGGEHGLFLICYTPRRAIEALAISNAARAGFKQVEVRGCFQRALARQQRNNTMRLLQFERAGGDGKARI